MQKHWLIPEKCYRARRRRKNLESKDRSASQWTRAAAAVMAAELQCKFIQSWNLNQFLDRKENSLRFDSDARYVERRWMGGRERAHRFAG